jgi:hypothetical protein
MEGGVKGNKKLYERWKMEVSIIKNMMGIEQNNKLKFQKPPKHHPFQGEGPHVEHPFTQHFL